jgi:hypothetical protein
VYTRLVVVSVFQKKKKKTSEIVFREEELADVFREASPLAAW